MQLALTIEGKNTNNIQETAKEGKCGLHRISNTSKQRVTKMLISSFYRPKARIAFQSSKNHTTLNVQ